MNMDTELVSEMLWFPECPEVPTYTMDTAQRKYPNINATPVSTNIRIIFMAFAQNSV
jgi:hypothetical protein